MSTRFHEQLLDQARDLAVQEHGKPKQASLRRSVSAAYYALFHFLCDEGAREMVGTGRRNRTLGNALVRAFEHAAMKQASARFMSAKPRLPRPLEPCVTGPELPPDLVTVASSFVILQEGR